MLQGRFAFALGKLVGLLVDMRAMLIQAGACRGGMVNRPAFGVKKQVDLVGGTKTPEETKELFAVGGEILIDNGEIEKEVE